MQNQNQSNLNPNKPKGQLMAGWTFPEYVQYERSRKWRVWMVIIAGGLMIWALWTFNFLFAVIILMFAVILRLQAKKPPMDVNFKIFEDGLQIGLKFYKYKEIKNFWILYEPPEVKNLYLHFKNKIRPALLIPLLKQNPIKIREVLLKYLDEDLEKDEESFAEILGRRLKI